MKYSKLGEFELIDQLTRNLSKYKKEVIKGIGDDCAVLAQGNGKYLLVTCDVQVENVHFYSAVVKPQQIGQKAIAVNISDIVAMGGKPTFCLVSLIVPKKMSAGYVDSVYDGIKNECALYDVQIIGGNVSTGKQFVIDIFMMGEVEPDRLLLRSGAKPGDKVLVTGSLGKAAADLKSKKQSTVHPRLKESAVISRSKLATSMIDISDGLLSDVGHICNQSNVGVVIFGTMVPAFSSPKLALTGGEDYELLFTTPPHAVDDLIQLVKRETGTAVAVIGEITSKTCGKCIQTSGGQKRRFILSGWDHLK